MKTPDSGKATIAVVILLVVGAPSTAIADGGNHTEPVLDGRTKSLSGWTGFTTPSTAATGEEGVRWVVEIEAGAEPQLRTWANDTDSAVVRFNEQSNTALIEASPDDMGLSKLDQALDLGLAGEPYVNSVSVVEVLSRPSPVSLKTQAEATPLLADKPLVREVLAKGSYTQAGIAYAENSNVTTLREAREMTAATNLSVTGANQTVAVIDSGLNTANGSIFGQDGKKGSELRVLPVSKNMFTNKTVAEGGMAVLNDQMWHGTHVASTIAADTANDSYDGYAPDANILALKVFNSTEPTSTAVIARAIRYAADQDVDVIHMSLGTPIYEREVADAVQYALDRGSVVVVSAGNSRDTSRWLSTPSDVPEHGVLAVAAANYSEKGPKNAGIAYFSSLGNDPGTADASLGKTQGQNISVSAVGMELEAMVADQNGTLYSWSPSGTSMAAPAVSGSILLALEANPSWENEPALVHQKVERGATAVPGAAFAETGHGYLNTTNLVLDREGGNQMAARTAQVREREQFYNWLHNAAGGILPLAEVHEN